MVVYVRKSVNYQILYQHSPWCLLRKKLVPKCSIAKYCGGVSVERRPCGPCLCLLSPTVMRGGDGILTAYLRLSRHTFPIFTTVHCLMRAGQRSGLATRYRSMLQLFVIYHGYQWKPKPQSVRQQILVGPCLERNVDPRGCLETRLWYVSVSSRMCHHQNGVKNISNLEKFLEHSLEILSLMSLWCSGLFRNYS